MTERKLKEIKPVTPGATRAPNAPGTPGAHGTPVTPGAHGAGVKDISAPLDTARKRLFIGLIAASSLLLSLLLVLGWGIPYIGFSNIHPSVPYIAAIIFGLIILTISWAAFGLVLQILTNRRLPGAGKTRGMAIKFFLPLMELIARACGISAFEVRRSFIKVNNELVQNMAHTQPPEKILILLPHCLQWSGCGIRINNRVENCKRCGKCCMAGIIELGERYGVGIAIATGGTIARRIVVERRPGLIVAVACERDLSSGIQDTYPLPVFGVLNERPFGPCCDTTVPLDKVEEALRCFIKPQNNIGEAPPPQTPPPKGMMPFGNPGNL